MGFVKPPNQSYDKILFINNCQGYPWSWPDNIPCKEMALEGKPVGLQIRQSEYKDKVSEKLHLLLKDDEFTYCIRCGLETVFSRGLLLGLRACLSQQTDCQIIISPKISERDSRVIFCNLWANNQRVKIEWDKDIELYYLAQDLSKYFPSVSFEQDKEDVSDIISQIKQFTFTPEEIAEIKAASSLPIAPVVEPLKKYAENRLFSETSVPVTGEIDFQTLLSRNDADIKYLGLSANESRQMLIDKYGKRSRHLLTNEELIDFVSYVDSLIQEKSFAAPIEVPDDCPF